MKKAKHFTFQTIKERLKTKGMGGFTIKKVGIVSFDIIKSLFFSSKVLINY